MFRVRRAGEAPEAHPQPGIGTCESKISGARSVVRGVPLNKEAEKRRRVRRPVSRVLSRGAPRRGTAGMAIHLGRPSPDASRDLPGRRRGNPPGPPCGGPAVPMRSCSRWGLPCRTRCRARGALLPHPFTLAGPGAGGLLSVALSLGSPPPGVTRHRVSVEPGLSSPGAAQAVRRRPSGRLTLVSRYAPPLRGSSGVAG